MRNPGLLILLLFLQPVFAEDADSISLLSARMCIQLQTSQTEADYNVGEKVESHILTFLKIDRETEKYRLKLAKFWNANAEYFICSDEIEGLRSPQHFMKRVIDMNMYNSVLFDWLLLDDRECPITVNQIEIYNGKKETVLDYIQKIISNPGNEEKYSFSDLQVLETTLVQYYGAKKASEL